MAGRDGFVEDSDYVFSVTAEITNDGNNYMVEGEFADSRGDQIIVRTHPLPSPVVTHIYGQAHSPAIALERFDDEIMAAATVYLGVEAQAASHQFSILAPSTTGIQAKSHDQHMCLWRISPVAYTQTPWQASTDAFYIERCGLGDGSSKLEIMARAFDSGGVARDLGTYASVVMPQASHQADNVVMYRIGDLPPTATPTPTSVHVPIDPYPTPDFPAAIATAASEWNSAALGVSFCGDDDGACRVSNTDGRRITIDVVTPIPTPAAPSTPTPRIDGCGGLGALACVTDDRELGDSHIGNQTMIVINPVHIYVENFPGVYELVEAQWTEDQSLAQQANYYYRPETLLHEFGHAAGLGHGYLPDDVMYQKNTAQPGLTDNDKRAMEANYAGHSPH